MRKQPLAHIDQAVILAGGRGERLRPLTYSIPKPLAPVNGNPFLDYLVNSLLTVGITKILFLLGYKAEVVKRRYSNMNGMDMEFSHGTIEHETGRRILNAYDLLDDHFLLVYGDNYWPIQLENMMELYRRTSARVSTTVFSNTNGTGEYGYENNVVVGNDGLVIKYDKKRETSEANGVDIGYFLVAKDALDPKISGNVSFEVDILPQFISQQELAAYVTDTQYYYITNMDTLRSFETAAKENSFVPLPQNYFIES